MGVPDFATSDVLSVASTCVGAKKVEVAATHQVQSGAHQPNGSVADIMCFPGGSGRHAALPEQCARDRAIGFASEVSIERAKRERKSPASRRREAVRAIGRSPCDGTPQAKRSVSAGGEVLIERDDGGGRCRSRGLADQHHGKASLGSSEEQIVAVACGALEDRRQYGDVARIAESLWRGREKNDSRSNLRLPNRRSPVCALVRVEREISNPSAPAKRLRAHWVFGRERRGKRAGMLDFAARTHRRFQRN